jgi:uncharacterized phiE125 gp8 family phage protein
MRWPYDYGQQYRLRPVRTVAPAADLIAIAEACRHCRVELDEQAEITPLIEAATSYLDGYDGILGQALVNQTWAQSFDRFCTYNRLPLEPLVSITSVTYYDADNAQQTLSTDVYTFRTDDLGPFVTLKSSQTWPTVYYRQDAVTITAVYGFGAAGTDVPRAIRQAALQIISHWNENREAVGSDRLSEMPLSACELLAPYRRKFFA